MLRFKFSNRWAIGLAFIALSALASCSAATTDTVTVITPTVVSTTPANEATAQTINTTVAAVFSEVMDSATITTTSFTLLHSSGNAVDGDVSYSGKAATFTATADLEPNITYTASITIAVTNTAGTAIEGEYTWTFTTAIAPTITSVTPVSGAADQTTGITVTAVFSEEMDLTTITDTTFTLFDGSLNSLVAGTVAYSGTVATFTPDSILNTQTTYTATITTGVTSVAGAAMASDAAWSFTTGTVTVISSLSPLDGAVAQPIGAAVSVVFAEAMDSTTITTTSLTLVNSSAVPVSGTVAYSGTTATFTPTSALESVTTYTATLTTAVKSSSGIALSSNVSWSFTTGVALSTQAGTAGSDISRDIAVDIDGSIYITGSTNGDLGSQSNVGEDDMFLAKYDIDGTSQWTSLIGTTTFDAGESVAVDFNGNVFATGYTEGSIAPGTNAGGKDIVITKYNSNGVNLWTVMQGTTAAEAGTGIAVDLSNNVIVTGYTDGDLNGTNAGSSDIFVVKYDTAGTVVWTVQLGTTGYDAGNDITTDKDGNIYITGVTSGDLSSQTNQGFLDIFVAKFNSAGVRSWTALLGTGTSAADMGESIAVDSAGSVYITGYTNGALDGNANSGGTDIFLAKYSTSGVKQWTKLLGTGDPDVAMGVGLDQNGNIYITGYTEGDLGGNTNTGASDIFLSKYGPAGILSWTKMLGTTADDICNGIDIDLSGKVYMTGYTTGSLGGANAGNKDLFIVKM